MKNKERNKLEYCTKCGKHLDSIWKCCIGELNYRYGFNNDDNKYSIIDEVDEVDKIVKYVCHECNNILTDEQVEYFEETYCI